MNLSIARSLLGLVLIPALFAGRPAHAADSEEMRGANDFGVMISQSNDGTQVGVVKETEKFEINFTFDGLYEKKGGAATPDGETYNLGVTARVGYRTSIGEGNYFTAGVEGHRGLMQKTDGFVRDPQVFVGPYVGIQRHFPKSNFILLGWICPYAYVMNTAVDNTGAKSSDNQHQFFEVGGIGFAYAL